MFLFSIITLGCKSVTTRFDEGFGETSRIVEQVEQGNEHIRVRIRDIREKQGEFIIILRDHINRIKRVGESYSQLTKTVQIITNESCEIAGIIYNIWKQDYKPEIKSEDINSFIINISKYCGNYFDVQENN